MAHPPRVEVLAHDAQSSLAAMRVWIEVLRTGKEAQRAAALEALRDCLEGHGRALDALLAEVARARADAGGPGPSAVAEPSPSPPRARDATAPALAGVRVLLVDDEPMMREGVAVLLEAHGARVVTAASGDEARARLLGGEPIDVLVSDLALGDDGGALATLRGQGGAAAKLPAIALTALAPPDPRAVAAAEAFDEVLRKPCDPEALLGAIARAAARGGGDAPMTTTRRSRPSLRWTAARPRRTP